MALSSLCWNAEPLKPGENQRILNGDGFLIICYEHSKGRGVMTTAVIKLHQAFATYGPLRLLTDREYDKLRLSWMYHFGVEVMPGIVAVPWYDKFPPVALNPTELAPLHSASQMINMADSLSAANCAFQPRFHPITKKLLGIDFYATRIIGAGELLCCSYGKEFDRHIKRESKLLAANAALVKSYVKTRDSAGCNTQWCCDCHKWIPAIQFSNHKQKWSKGVCVALSDASKEELLSEARNKGTIRTKDS
jgi:hypothetical protein